MSFDFLYAGSPSPISLIERNEILETYSHVFYPSVPDVREAVPVVVEPGLNLPGLDMTMNPQPSFRVRGRVVDSVTGKTPLNATVELRYGNNFQYANPGNEYIGGEKGTYANGVFEFRQVVPGMFYVTASSLGAGAGVGAGEGTIDNLTYRNAAASVVVSSRDIEDVVVTLPGKPAPLSGRMTVEGRPYPLESRGVQIHSAGEDRMQPESYWADMIANGVLRFENVSPGDYRVFAWETLEPYEYFDPDLLARSASKSVAVHLSELSKQNVEVRVQ